ncbi:MAG: hypothetical protein K6G37_01150 [Bacilli bacterium]|nr:hypothetical protein [Bacilli bacterium]
MTEQSKALKIDAIVLMALYAALYIFYSIYDGFSARLTISLAINALLLCGIIYYSDKNAKLTGALGICFSALLVLSGGILEIVMGVVMAYRSIICLTK